MLGSIHEVMQRCLALRASIGEIGGLAKQVGDERHASTQVFIAASPPEQFAETS